MKRNILAAIYTIVREFTDSPFTAHLVAQQLLLTEQQVQEVFIELKNEGLIKRRYIWTGVYRVTDIGLEASKNAFTDSVDFI